MSAHPTMMDLPTVSNDQQMQDIFRLAGQPDGVVCQPANAGGSGFIFVNGTLHLVPANEYARYLQDIPHGVGMQMDGPMNQSPQSLPSSIYTLPGLANVPGLEDTNMEYQPDYVPPQMPCHVDEWNIPLDGLPDDLYLQASVNPLELISRISEYMPVETDVSGLPTDATAGATLDASPAGLPKSENTDADTEDATKHKVLFGCGGWLGPHQSSVRKLPPREPIRDLKHNMHLQFLNVTASDARIGSGKDKHGNPISMGAIAQAVLYRELIAILVTAVNTFLVQQNEEGRISQKSIDDVNMHWSSKRFSPVTEFRWDLDHQRTLVGMNFEGLEYAGRAWYDPFHAQQVLSGWKVIARDAPRKFRGIKDCLPDRVIRIHLSHARDMLEMVNVPESTFAAFAEFSDHAKDFMVS